MKVCDLCGSLDVLLNDEENQYVDVHLCKKCKDQLEKSNQDAKEGRISKLDFKEEVS